MTSRPAPRAWNGKTAKHGIARWVEQRETHRFFVKRWVSLSSTHPTTSGAMIMKIVDAQIHLWHQNLPANAAHRQITSWTAEDCLNERYAAGVDAALIHPPGWDPNSGAIAEAAARKYPDRFAILGNFPPDKPESRDLVAGWKSRPGMLGLRWAFTQPHQQSWMTDGTMDWVWP